MALQAASPIPGGSVMVLLVLVGAIIVLITRALAKRNKGDSSITGTAASAQRTDQQRKAVGGFVKRCPTCQSIFTDETLAFCLSDGSTLERVANTFTANDPNATLVYREAVRSDLPPTVQYHPDMSPNKKG